jgi:hypothetical protein
MTELQDSLRQILDSLGRVNRRLRDAAVKLGRSPKVVGASASLEVMGYENKSCVEGYVEAELKDGNGISWLFDLEWNNGSWVVRGSLERYSAVGRETLDEVPEEEISDVKLLPGTLDRIAQKLLALRAPDMPELL